MWLLPRSRVEGVWATVTPRSQQSSKSGSLTWPCFIRRPKQDFLNPLLLLFLPPPSAEDLKQRTIAVVGPEFGVRQIGFGPWVDLESCLTFCKVCLVLWMSWRKLRIYTHWDGMPASPLLPRFRLLPQTFEMSLNREKSSSEISANRMDFAFIVVLDSCSWSVWKFWCRYSLLTANFCCFQNFLGCVHASVSFRNVK